ncbi:hypothetical protein JVU11DRAFT_8808 [Chiua virens]|nr:hypothetical protein JVU11DRAFT_8808 [Chiua virens]
MTASVVRRRQHGHPKPPSVSDTEYFSDSQTHPAAQSLSTTEDAHSSPSEQYASEVDSAAEESDGPASGSTLPPPSATGLTSGELKVPDLEAELPDAVNEGAWYEFDFTVVFALLSPIANWLTGSDLVKNVFLIFLLVFYLHQIIEVPWSLYLASRPRHPIHGSPHAYTSNADKYHHAAASELHTLEIFYLILSVLSPFLGATLLRTVVISFSGQSTVSWFSLSLFVLATGMRPWKHAIQRLRGRTTDLHTIIHYPPSDVQKMQALVDRITQLEAELKSLRRQSKSFNSEMYNHVDDAIEMIEIATRRQEKKTDVSKAFWREGWQNWNKTSSPF